jgi:hypothetical protein
MIIGGYHSRAEACCLRPSLRIVGRNNNLDFSCSQGCDHGAANPTSFFACGVDRQEYLRWLH